MGIGKETLRFVISTERVHQWLWVIRFWEGECVRMMKEKRQEKRTMMAEMENKPSENKRV